MESTFSLSRRILVGKQLSAKFNLSSIQGLQMGNKTGVVASVLLHKTIMVLGKFKTSS